MLKRERKLLVALVFLSLALAVAGYFVVSPVPIATTTTAEMPRPASKTPAPNSTMPAPVIVKKRTLTADAPAADHEMLVRISNPAQMQAFLERARALGVRVEGYLPRLHTARLLYDDAAERDALLATVPNQGEAGLNYLVSLPPDPVKSAPDSGGPYLGFGTQALDWLGVPANNNTWGSGIKVAVLDTGIEKISGLASGGLSQIDLVNSSTGDATALEHGTAVASILTGSTADPHGIAPAANLLSIRVLDSTGTGNSFTVAQGILTAVDNGARIISLSLGSYGDSPVLQDAVNYALGRNVAIVAAAGNDGTNGVAYPARYPGVIAVTAVDATGRRGEFANYGPEIALAAPGVGVSTTASTDPQQSFSGTSAAVPFVSGAIAGLLSQNSGINAREAASLLTQYANDAGAPGIDDRYGAGILNIDRVLNRKTPGINDAAVADFSFDPAAASGASLPVTVSVQNRGTTTLSNVKLQVAAAGAPATFYLGGIPAGQVRAETVLVNPALLQTANGLPFQAQVSTVGATDSNSANDTKAVVLRIKKTSGD